jgi:Ca2+/Na+ antiporter
MLAYIAYGIYVASYTLIPALLISSRYKVIQGQQGYYMPTFWGMIIILLFIIGIFGVLREVCRHNQDRLWARYFYNSQPLFVVITLMFIFKMLENQFTNITWILGYSTLSIMIGILFKVYYDVKKGVTYYAANNQSTTTP